MFFFCVGFYTLNFTHFASQLLNWSMEKLDLHYLQIIFAYFPFLSIRNKYFWHAQCSYLGLFSDTIEPLQDELKVVLLTYTVHWTVFSPEFGEMLLAVLNIYEMLPRFLICIHLQIVLTCKYIFPVAFKNILMAPPHKNLFINTIFGPSKSGVAVTLIHRVFIPLHASKETIFTFSFVNLCC